MVLLYIIVGGVLGFIFYGEIGVAIGLLVGAVIGFLISLSQRISRLEKAMAQLQGTK